MTQINHQYAGMLGYYGISLSESRNKKLQEANKLVDEYNAHVYDFETFDEQIAYQKVMMDKIKQVLKDDE